MLFIVHSDLIYLANKLHLNSLKGLFELSRQILNLFLKKKKPRPSN